MASGWHAETGLVGDFALDLHTPAFGTITQGSRYIAAAERLNAVARMTRTPGRTEAPRSRPGNDPQSLGQVVKLKVARGLSKLVRRNGHFYMKHICSGRFRSERVAGFTTT